MGRELAPSPLQGEGWGEGGRVEIGKKMRQVLIYFGEDDFWIAECPSLPGCITQGETKEEAIANIKEAIDLYIEVLEEDQLEVPQERFDAMLVAV